MSDAMRQGIVDTAAALGLSPVDLATIISYETGGTFNPSQRGPTTKWGTHRGLIQFGEPQARQYGVNWDDPIGSQLGPDGAVVKYMLGSGFKPGMSLEQAYATINAGSPYKLGARDAAAGGMPGTVSEKVRDQFGPHRAKAMAFLDMQDGAAGPASSRLASVGGNAGSPSNVSGTRLAGGSPRVMPTMPQPNEPRPWPKMPAGQPSAVASASPAAQLRSGLGAMMAALGGMGEQAPPPQIAPMPQMAPAPKLSDMIAAMTAMQMGS